MKNSIYAKISIITMSFFLLSNIVNAEKGISLLLKTGNIKIEKQKVEEIENFTVDNLNTYVILSFKSIPDNEKKASLEALGIKLYSYLPQNSYYAFLSKSIRTSDLVKFDIYAINPIWASTKFHPILQNIPDWAMEGNKVSLILSYFEGISKDELSIKLSNFNVEITNISEESQRAFVKIDPLDLERLGDAPFIFFIEPVDPPAYPENYGGRSQHRSNMLAQEFASGTKYDGTGVSIGMHDDGIIGPHIDYEGRIPIQFPTNNFGNHGDHVAGTIMGAGNLDPKGRGSAFGADLYVYTSSNANYNNTVSHYNLYDIYIVSKSYSNGCNAGYTSLSLQLDKQTRQNPFLLHVFSAGNNGTSNCNYGAGAGWGNITGGHKMGKNVVTTGNLTSTDALASSSSRGPADDGRIKPDICAKGTSVYSTVDENDYAFKTGTSMSAPGIAGSMGQLYHAYKSLNSNQNPSSGLIKGIVLNTADDLGNPGPDYKFGWGRINLRRALAILDNNQYISSSISGPASNTHTLTLPANLKQVRIMIYWHDYEATTAASRAIVNNLDMTVTDPSNAIFLPWVLNPAANATTLNNNAVRAVDTLNNMEQVTIDNPAQGSYTVTIIPTSVPQGPQSYHIIYEYIYDEVFLTYPNGGEGFVPGEIEAIRWDAFGTATSFDVEYSTNGGTSWSTISSSLAGSLRQVNWSVPSTVTNQAKVRVTRGLISDESDVNFNIIRVPANLQIEWNCPDSMKLKWSSVTSANSYRIYQLGAKYMDSVSTSSTNSYIFRNTNPGVQYWLSVSANPTANSTGRRAIAIQSAYGVKNCPLKDDASISSFKTPTQGTILTCVNNELKYSFYIKNDGINPIQNVPFDLFDKSGLAFTGTYADTIQPGDSVLYTHSSTKILTGNNFDNLKCATKYIGDKNIYNDTSKVSFAYKAGAAVKAPWTENFEAFIGCATLSNCGGTRCFTINGWVNDSTYFLDDHDWRTNSGPTPSGQTGPSIDNNPGTAAGKYMYLEASSNCNLQTAQLMTPCLDLTGMSKPRFKYYYHMFGPDMGELHIDLLTPDGWMIDIQVPKTGNRGDGWLVDSLDLESYAGEVVSVRFRGITGVNFRSDMALDDMSFYESDAYIGISENSDLSRINIYPNPSKDIFFLEWNGNEDMEFNFVITDISGKVIESNYNANRQNNRYVIDLTSYKNGAYLLQIHSDGEIVTKKLIKL